MSEIDEDRAACAQAHTRLHQILSAVDDQTVRAPSRLPGWTVGHVLTHLARNADSVVRRLDGAARGEQVDQYPGGARGRAAEIESGQGRSAKEIIDDLVAADAAVDAAFAAATPDVWQRTVRAGSGELIPATQLLFSRWREVEVHHVDLGLGYGWEQWPDGLVARWLPKLLAELSDRADGRALMAWTLGRAPMPELRPWG
ncbi:maleylpyruvate isomerase [Catellatospora methionotrophica]|uniref:Maleylpyruvate isomerase n=1 Tax=Catellatospora methionotrophica TaxID=121620 RepID=A0A8J3LMK9_9ACTN|nr:maleylpyruvate isomerase N-terminal domain-containing protein [Catellatospora methionotrophica]GIG18339.1 maleylpyruvate isomerase [Catellatospora methionotrophica]